jgi:hypothetical protein
MTKELKDTLDVIEKAVSKASEFSIIDFSGEYTINDRMKLVIDKDGSAILYFQPERPISYINIDLILSDAHE